MAERIITGVVGTGSGRKTHIATMKVMTLEEWFDTFYEDLDNSGNRCYKDYRGTVICSENRYRDEKVEDAIVKFKEKLISTGNKYFIVSYDGYLCGRFRDYVTYDETWVGDLPQPTESNVTCKKCLSKMGIK